MIADPLVRLRRLGAERLRLLIRAGVLLTVVSVSVALLPFRRAIPFGSVPLGNRRRPDAKEIVWAVEAAARRLPWRTMCIEKGLVVQRMLRSGGVDAILHYGARHHDETRKLEAHVWVTVGDRVVIGGEETAGFAEVAAFP